MDERSSGGGQLPRRAMLALLAASGAGVAGTACTNTSGGGGAGASSASAHGSFDIPKPSMKLPAKAVTLRWMDTGGLKGEFFHAFFPAYQKQHTNVTVKYDESTWNKIQQVITLGVRNGTAPDVFQMPAQIPVAEAVANGWVGAIDDIVPNWAAVKKRYPPWIYANGVTDFDGKTYAFTVTSNQRMNNLLLFNADYAHRAGYDLSNTIPSWDEFRDIARKLTKQGNGKYYAIIFGVAQAGGLSGPVSDLAEMAGVHGGVNTGTDWRTGQFNYTNDITIAAIELMLALKGDGSVFPGSASLDGPGARQRMPQGLAAMMFQGPWNIAQWKQTNPAFSLGVNLLPQRNPKDIWPETFGPGGGNWFYSPTTKAGPVIGDIFSYLGTAAGQAQWAKYDSAGDPPAFPQALAKVKLDANDEKAVSLAAKYMVIRPEPAVRNPDVEKVYQAQKQLQPNFNDLLVGLFTGQIKTAIPKLMSDLQSRSEKNLDDAIAAAKKRGAKVSRDDWVFADWDPRKPYTKLY